MIFADTHIIILAAGSGSRFGAPLPKQFCDLGGRPVLMYTIDNMRIAAPGATLTLVLSADMIPLWESLCSRHDFQSPPIAAGGRSRFESTLNALRQTANDCRIIMVHDGARPFPTPGMLADLRQALDSPGCQGAIPAVAVTDSLRQVEPDGRSHAVDRAAFRAVQTPQAFPAALLRKAFETCDTAPRLLTDDASVMEAAGFNRFTLTPGDPDNIKITNPGDLAIAGLYVLKK